MEYRVLKVIAGKTGLQAGELARDTIRNLFLTTGAERLASSSRVLADSSRREMEALTGYDLSRALINTTFQAGSMARSLDAEAFTLGRHIFAPAEKIDTTFNRGKGLLAHELTHVIQQTAPARAANPAPCDEASASFEGQELPGKTAGESHAALPLVQMSRLNSGSSRADASQSELEEEAAVSEVAARDSARERSQREELDKDMLADMVYRFMQNDIAIHRDRRR